MILHDVVQGSPTWLQLRAGRPTASEFHKILTPKTAKPSASAEPYMYDLLAEVMLGRPLQTPVMPWMERGTLLEDDAAKWYAFQRDIEVKKVGFVTTDDGKIGASPDRLVGDDGLLELKVPSPGQHLRYLLFPQRGVDQDYRCQVMGQLLVTERKWCDVVSYHPELPSVIVRVERDEEFIGKLDTALKVFVQELELHRADLERLYGPFEHEVERRIELSEDDVESILSARREKPEYIKALNEYERRIGTGSLRAICEAVNIAEPSAMTEEQFNSIRRELEMQLKKCKPISVEELVSD